jgi:hypothetical protein
LDEGAIRRKFSDIILSDAQVSAAKGVQQGELFVRTVAELEKLIPVSRLPEPILAAQAVRYLNEEIKKGKLKYRVYLKPTPTAEEDTAEYLNSLLLSPLSSDDEERVEAFRSKSVGVMLWEMCSARNSSFVVYDNGIIAIVHRLEWPHRK